MKTHGEIEAAICELISRFEQDYMGRGPKDIRRSPQRQSRPPGRRRGQGVFGSIVDTAAPGEAGSSPPLDSFSFF